MIFQNDSSSSQKKRFIIFTKHASKTWKAKVPRKAPMKADLIIISTRKKSLIHFTDGCFRCGINRWRLSWQNRRWRRGFFGKSVFDPFAFVVDPHQWNDDSDNAQPLCCCCENVFGLRRRFGWRGWRFGGWSFGRRGNWISMLCPRNDALCLDKNLFSAAREQFSFSRQ